MTSEVDQFLAQFRDGSTERRSHARQPLNVNAHVLIDGEWTPCVIKDASEVAAKLRGLTDLTVGAAVELQVPTLDPIPGTVMRRDEDSFVVQLTHSAVSREAFVGFLNERRDEAA